MPKYGRVIYSVYSCTVAALSTSPPWLICLQMGSSKDPRAAHHSGACKHQNTVLTFSSLTEMLKWSFFQGFSCLRILSERSSRVSCHGSLLWLQEKNFFVLITRKSQGKNFFCPSRRFVHCNNSGGSVSPVMGLLQSKPVQEYPSLWHWNITFSNTAVPIKYPSLKHHLFQLFCAKLLQYLPIKYPSTLTTKHHSIQC